MDGSKVIILKRNLKNLIILLNLALEVLNHIVKYLVVKM